MTQVIKKLGYSELVFGNYLEIVVWNVGIRMGHCW